MCDEHEWARYFDNFKENKVSDQRLGQLTDTDYTVHKTVTESATYALSFIAAFTV